MARKASGCGLDPLDAQFWGFFLKPKNQQDGSTAAPSLFKDESLKIQFSLDISMM